MKEGSTGIGEGPSKPQDAAADDLLMAGIPLPSNFGSVVCRAHPSPRPTREGKLPRRVSTLLYLTQKKRHTGRRVCLCSSTLCHRLTHNLTQKPYPEDLPRSLTHKLTQKSYPKALPGRNNIYVSIDVVSLFPFPFFLFSSVPPKHIT